MARMFRVKQFYSIGEFLDASEAGASPRMQSHTSDPHWAGTDSFEECMKFARYGGWEPEMATELRHIFDGLEPRLRKYVDTDFERHLDQSGFEVNMQAYLDGEPDHMFQWTPSDHLVTRRVITLLIGHSISSGCSAKEIFIRGQAAIALVRALALLGYELEIWSEETIGGEVKSGPDKGVTEISSLVRLHAAGTMMDESALEFAIGNPSWLRRLVFGYQEGYSDPWKKGFDIGSSYGSCVPIRHQGLVGADICLDLGRTWFDGDRGYDLEEAGQTGADWVVGQLVKAGVIEQP